jgi:hypothetical protein
VTRPTFDLNFYVAVFASFITLAGNSTLLEYIRSEPFFLQATGSTLFTIIVAAFFGTTIGLFTENDMLTGFALALNTFVAIASMFDAVSVLDAGYASDRKLNVKTGGLSLVFAGAVLSSLTLLVRKDQIVASQIKPSA